MFVCCKCCVLSGRGLCDELITRPEESYRLWCVVVCDLETSRMWRPWPALGRSATGKIIIIIIIIIIISFMQGICTCIPETNYVPRQYSIAAILLLLFTVLIPLVPALNLLYFYISTFRSMCAVSNMAVFWSSLTSCFPGMLPTYFLNDFEIVPVAPIITGITLCFYIPHALYFHCKVFIF